MLLNVGASATIKSLPEPDLSADERRRRRRTSAVREFFSRLTGIAANTVRVIVEVLEFWGNQGIGQAHARTRWLTERIASMGLAH